MKKSALRLAKGEEKETGTAKLLDRISGFFYEKRKIVLICAIVLLVALVALGVGLTTADRREDARQVEASALQDETKKLFEGEYTPEQYASLVERLEDLAKRGGKNYSGLKASYVLGLAYQGAKGWANAYDAFMKVAGASKSYLAPLALYNAAVAKEEGGDADEALKLYERVPADFGYDTAAAPRALFNSARLHLGKGEVDLAKSTYQQIIDKYPESEYTALSKNKLLSL